MFTGIIENTGKVLSAMNKGSNRIFHIESNLSSSLKIDESLSHDGVCLTIENVTDSEYQVTAIAETLEVTTLGNWKTGDLINLERAMKLNGRLDGHLVQGMWILLPPAQQKKTLDGSTEFTFSFDKKFAANIIEKGSVCVDGISLTAFEVSENTFTVAIIPYTLEHTNIKFLEENKKVNIEFDMIGKYVQRIATIHHL